MIAHARQVADTAAPDQDDRVFLKVVALAADVGGDLLAVGQPDPAPPCGARSSASSGVIVLTWRQTPRLNGQDSSTGALVLYFTGRRGLRTSWLIVGMSQSFPLPRSRHVFSSGPSSVAGRGNRLGWSLRLGQSRNRASRHGRGLDTALTSLAVVPPAIRVGTIGSYRHGPVYSTRGLFRAEATSVS